MMMMMKRSVGTLILAEYTYKNIWGKLQRGFHRSATDLYRANYLNEFSRIISNYVITTNMHWGFFHPSHARNVRRYVTTRSPAVAKITDRSFKVDDFHYIWKGLCYFLLLVNSNLGCIFHGFRYIISFQLKYAHYYISLLHLTSNLKMFPLHKLSLKFCVLRFKTQVNYLYRKNFPPTSLALRPLCCVA